MISRSTLLGHLIMCPSENSTWPTCKASTNPDCHLKQIVQISIKYLMSLSRPGYPPLRLRIIFKRGSAVVRVSGRKSYDSTTVSCTLVAAITDYLDITRETLFFSLQRWKNVRNGEAAVFHISHFYANFAVSQNKETVVHVIVPARVYRMFFHALSVR